MEDVRDAEIKDLEINFVGMAFIIHGALNVIKNAIVVINMDFDAVEISSTNLKRC